MMIKNKSMEKTVIKKKIIALMTQHLLLETTQVKLIGWLVIDKNTSTIMGQVESHYIAIQAKQRTKTHR